MRNSQSISLTVRQEFGWSSDARISENPLDEIASWCGSDGLRQWRSDQLGQKRFFNRSFNFCRHPNKFFGINLLFTAPAISAQFSIFGNAVVDTSHIDFPIDPEVVGSSPVRHRSPYFQTTIGVRARQLLLTAHRPSVGDIVRPWTRPHVPLKD